MGNDRVDLSRYEKGNPVMPGVYAVDVAVNDRTIGRRELTFVAANDGGTEGVACITPDLIRDMSLTADIEASATPDANGCVDLATLVPDARLSYDASSFRLKVRLPHASLLPQGSNYVAPERLDNGTTAAFVNYRTNAREADRQRSLFTSLDAGLNVGAWRLRHRGSLSVGEGDRRYDRIATYAERGIAAWNSRLIVGESNSSGELFDSIGFTGIQVGTDDRMLPDNLQGFAPVVRGSARTDARVSVRQNGHVIYEINVAPGPFAINDLYPTSYGGDLEVTVLEADGAEQRFTVNFAAVPRALREGLTRYSATLGRMRQGEALGEPVFAQLTWGRGLSNRHTLLLGGQVSENYASALVGGAVNTAIGAFGADVTASHATVARGTTFTGGSLRLNYQRMFAESNTHFGVAAYRYSTRRYLTLADAARIQYGGVALAQRPRNRLEVVFNQAVASNSSVYVRGGYTNYWSQRAVTVDYQLGFQSIVGDLTYDISAQRTIIEGGRRDNAIRVSVNVPLGSSPRAPSFSAALSRGSRSDAVNAGINGTLGANNTFNYSASAYRDDDRAGMYASGQYRSHLGNLSASYAGQQGQHRLGFGMEGSLVAHGGGLNFAPPVSETFAIVHADGAQGARLGSSQATVGRNGYGIVPSLATYRWSDVTIDPTGTSLDVELMQTSTRVAPTSGAAVTVAFETRVDTTTLIQSRTVDGTPLPFGAEVIDARGTVVGVVGQGGIVHVRGDNLGALRVDQGTSGMCEMRYDAPIRDASGIRWTAAICSPVDDPSSTRSNPTDQTIRKAP